LTKPDDYLKQYGDVYRVAKSEDGIWQIETTHKARHGLTFEVYVYSDTHLAVLLPPMAAKHLLQRTPGKFTVHQNAGDGTVLLFAEEVLHELAKDMKLKKKRKLSVEHRRKLATSNMRYRFRPASKSERMA
jgi:hypothetical protein